MPHLHFDIMDSAGYGYYRVWTERAYLLRLAFIPVLIKLACTVTILVLGFEDNILRQGLIMLPADLAQGWVLAQFLRTLLKGERWPTVIPPDLDERMLDKLFLRARGILAATISYALIAMCSYMLRYLVFGTLDESDFPQGLDSGAISGTDNNTQPPVPVLPPYFLLSVFFALGVIVAGFRLLWLYIPFSVLMPVKDYLKAVSGFGMTVRMMALFFCAMSPVAFLMFMISRFFYGIFGGGEDLSLNIGQFLTVGTACVADMIMALATTAAFVWAMRDILPKAPDLLKDFPRLKK